MVSHLGYIKHEKNAARYIDTRCVLEIGCLFLEKGSVLSLGGPYDEFCSACGSMARGAGS